MSSQVRDDVTKRRVVKNWAERCRKDVLQIQRSMATMANRTAANVLLAVMRTAAAGTPGVGVGMGVGKGGRLVLKLVVVTVPGASVTTEVSVMTVEEVISDDEALELILELVVEMSVVVTSVEVSVVVSAKPVDSADSWLLVVNVGDCVIASGAVAVEVALPGELT
jgi:hypothetical protein